MHAGTRAFIIVATFLSFIEMHAVRADPPTESIVFGSIPLTIGMPQDDVLASLEHYYKLSETEGSSESSSSWFLMNKGSPSPRFVGNIRFENHHLTNALKYWSADNKEASFDTALKLYGAINNLTDSNPSACTVETAHKETRGSDEKTILITCGTKKYISISALEMNGDPPAGIIIEELRSK